MFYNEIPISNNYKGVGLILHQGRVAPKSRITSYLMQFLSVCAQINSRLVNLIVIYNFCYTSVKFYSVVVDLCVAKVF